MELNHVPDSALSRVERLHLILTARATGGVADQDEFAALRKVLLDNQQVGRLLPGFLRNCRTLAEFWSFIKMKFPTYAERRNFLREEFAPVFEFLERPQLSPAVELVGRGLDALDPGHIRTTWQQAIDRTAGDPEGAITLARTLLETVCKALLEKLNIPHAEDDDLPKLYKKISSGLNLAPSQHEEPVFKRILGATTSVVSDLSYVRNKLGDAHGRGALPVRPKSRHAEFTVNLAGAVALFLVATWSDQAHP